MIRVKCGMFCETHFNVRLATSTNGDHHCVSYHTICRYNAVLESNQ